MERRYAVPTLCAALALVAAFPLGAKPGDWSEVGDANWSGAIHMAALDGALWIIDGSTLYKVSTK